MFTPDLIAQINKSPRHQMFADSLSYMTLYEKYIPYMRTYHSLAFLDCNDAQSILTLCCDVNDEGYHFMSYVLDGVYKAEPRIFKSCKQATEELKSKCVKVYSKHGLKAFEEIVNEILKEHFIVPKDNTDVTAVSIVEKGRHLGSLYQDINS